LAGDGSFVLIDLPKNAPCTNVDSHIVYNKWHETELERWLSDHNIPYPSPADRKDLENIVKENWQSKVATPYTEWDAPQLQAYLKEKSVDAQKGTEKSKDGLIAQVKKNWYEAEDSAEDAWQSVKDWIFDRFEMPQQHVSQKADTS
jgi:hypothetical protein